MNKFIPIFLVMFFVLNVSSPLANDISHIYIKTKKIKTHELSSNLDNGTVVTLPTTLENNVSTTTREWLVIEFSEPFTGKIDIDMTKTGNYTIFDENKEILSQRSILGGGVKKADLKDAKYIGIATSISTESVVINNINFYTTYDPITNLSGNTTFNSVNLSWDNPKSSDFIGVLIKQNGIEIGDLGKVNSFMINGLDSDKEYTFDVIAKYLDGNLSDSESVNVTTDSFIDDNNPPGEITSLSYGVTSFDSTFNWINPSDTDFSHIKIYKDGTLIEDNLKTNKYTATGLVPNKVYVFKFVTVDEHGNRSSGYIQTVKTDPEFDNIAPLAPRDVTITDGNKSGRITWTKNTELDMSYYNIYVDGIKHNASPVLTNNYVINGLENDEVYEITLTAVDTSGNESSFSEAKLLVPSESTMPVFKNNYDLKNVADGTGNWFTTLWPILAFSVGISLAFIISNRIKTLFFA